MTTSIDEKRRNHDGLRQSTHPLCTSQRAKVEEAWVRCARRCTRCCARTGANACERAGIRGHRGYVEGRDIRAHSAQAHMT
eukprot:scaffold273154_cov35-Tisochrysis_lutea.AAC.1